MSSAPMQSYSNHVRFDPLFHFTTVPVFFGAVIWAIVHLVRHPSWQNGGLLLLLLAATMAVTNSRLYALKVQTRVIRLEERLRLQALLSEQLRTRIPELTESQLVALRFASDAECPALAEQALFQDMKNAQIKKAIQQWRPDYWRV